MSDPSLDALAAAAAVHLAALDAPECPRWECMRHPCDVCVARRAARDTLNERAPDIARGYVAAVDALRAERETRAQLSEAVAVAAGRLDLHDEFIRGRHDGMSARHAAPPFVEEPDDVPAPPDGCGDHWQSGWRRGWSEMAAVVDRDAAIARATAAEAQRDALAAAVRAAIDVERRASEHLGSAQSARDDVLLECGEREEAAMAALDVAANEFVAARGATDALLSGCAADVVRAGVVRDHLAALDLLTTTRVDDTTPEMRGNAVATRTALDAALAAAEGRS